MIDQHQLKAVELHNSSALLLAGPGCGKTHILARRVFHANTVLGVPFADMLCLTFTNRAAREMENRVHGYLGAAPRGLFIGNIHRFCLRFLHANKLISPDATVIDEEDVTDYLKTALGICQPAAVKDFLDKAMYVYQLEHDHPDRVIRRPDRHPTEAEHAMIEAYSLYKETNRLLDYDDLLLHTYTALLDRSAADMKMTGYKWLQVDEVQDMTPLQLAIIDGVCVHGRRTALYLGDEQQAIFGFLGAGGRALDAVKEQCGTNILRLQRNYRSPDYLVNLCNGIARRNLGIATDFLPKAVFQSDTAHPLLTWDGDKRTLALVAAAQARQLLKDYPDKNVGILVHTNYDGKFVADLLTEHGFDFFHVSRPDIFHQAAFKTIWAHLAVVLGPTRGQEWARLLYQTRAVKTLSGARQLMNLLQEGAMSGDELLELQKPTAIERFLKAYSDTEKPIVVIDTETTGLDVFADDVIQIAAVKIAGGKEVPGSRFEVFIRTERSISRFLSDGKDNPMVRAYAEAVLMEPQQALAALSAYIGDSPLAGHNLGFDTAILKHNFQRRTSLSVPAQLEDQTGNIDTLHTARLLLPKLWSHKLENHIETLQLEGVNSHNASDDVAATVSLIAKLDTMAQPKAAIQAKIKSHSNVMKAALRFSAAYGSLYESTRHALKCNSGSLAGELENARAYLQNRGYIGPIRHFDYFLKLVDTLVVNKETERNFRSQAESHLTDLTTYNESDLLANGIVSERLSVMTVHKAKGLEMDNVIVFDASSRNGTAMDYARLLYVAFSRAKERLYVGCSNKAPNEILGTALRHFEALDQSEITLLSTLESVHKL